MARLTSIFAMALLLSAAAASGNPTERGDFVVPEAAAIQAVPAVAYDSTNDRFFTTWTDSRNQQSTRLDIYGRIVDAAGRPLGDDIAVSTAPGSQATAVVAFDPGRKRYLVVWADWRDAESDDSDIYGQFVDSNGALQGAAFPVARARVSQKYPSIAFDPANRRFLVVWADRREGKLDKIYGRFIGSDGRLDGSAFRLVDEGGYQERPSLTYDPKRERFLAVWRDREENRGIFAAFVSAEREAARARIRIAIEDEGCLPPSLYAASYAPDADVFLVAWTSGWNYAKQGLDVYATFLDGATGKVSNRPIPVATERDYQESAAVTYDSRNNRFLIVWYDLRRDHTARSMDIYGRFVTPGGALSEEFLFSDHLASGLKRFPAPAYSPRSDTFLVLWEDGRGGSGPDRRIYARVR